MITKNRIVQTCLIVVLGLCTLFSALISVLACIPVSTEVEIREEIKASASAVSAADASAYLVEVSGALKNTTGEALVIERLEIPVSATGRGGETVTVVLEQISIPARSTVTVAKTEAMSFRGEAVGAVTATVNGEEMFLRNPAETKPTVALIPIAITAIFAFLLVRACKVRYYMLQEDRA